MKPAQTPTPAAVSDILLYLANLIVEKQGNTKIRGDIEKIMNIQNMDILDQNAAAEEIFGRFEKILSEYFVLEKIKEDIREKFDLAKIRLPFINKFLPGNERGLRELEEKASIIQENFCRLSGARIWKNLSVKIQAPIFLREQRFPGTVPLIFPLLSKGFLSYRRLGLNLGQRCSISWFSASNFFSTTKQK